MALWSDRPVADSVQINIYGVTMNDLYNKGLDLNYLMGQYGVEDYVVFDVRRTDASIHHPQHMDIPVEHQLTPLKPGVLCSTEVGRSLLDCSLSTIASLLDDGVPEFSENLEASTQLLTFRGDRSVLEFSEDTVYSPPHMYSEIEDILKRIINAVVEEENCSRHSCPGLAKDDIPFDEPSLFAEGGIFGGFNSVEVQSNDSKRHSFSWLPSPNSFTPIPPRGTKTSPGGLHFSIPTQTTKRSNVPIIGSSLSIFDVTGNVTQKEPLSPHDNDEFFDCSESLVDYEAADYTMPIMAEEDTNSTVNPSANTKPRKPSLVTKVTCRFENCGEGILWKPSYGRQRLLDHIRSKHWKHKTLKCAFCDHMTAVGRNMQYHHRKYHAGEEFKKPADLQTKEQAKTLLELWRRCFSGKQLPHKEAHKFGV